jgi:hypothetical protein
MRAPQSVNSLEDLGRVRLSRNFFMREFLYSEIANFYGRPNIPRDPDLAIATGRQLCEELLEPLQATFGRVAIRSAYRSEEINALGNEKGHNCGSNESNYGAHIWDRRDSEGLSGAMACVVLPWFTDRYEKGTDWRALAYWIHDHLPYSQLQFFPRLCAFNIGWHEKPKRTVYSFIEPRGNLFKVAPTEPEYKQLYAGFPELVRSAA